MGCLVIASKRWLLHNNSTLTVFVNVSFSLWSEAWLRVSVESFAARHTQRAIAADALWCFPLLGVGLVAARVRAWVRSGLAEWSSTAVAWQLVNSLSIGISCGLCQVW